MITESAEEWDMSAKTYGDRFDRTTARWVRSTAGDAGGKHVEVSRLDDGGMAVRDSLDPDGPILYFTPAEWEAFVGGVKDGEFDV
jgi:hypothetical protein